MAEEATPERVRELDPRLLQIGNLAANCVEIIDEGGSFEYLHDLNLPFLYAAIYHYYHGSLDEGSRLTRAIEKFAPQPIES